MTIQPLKIGQMQLATNLLLAPIAGYCDLAFRLVARRFGGIGLGCTDLICSEAVVRNKAKTFDLAMTCPEDSPLCIQLYGGNTDRLCEAARWAEDRGAHVIDINMGCPVDKVTKLDGGSKLLCNPDNTLRMVEQIASSIRHTPLTAKLRLGWNDHAIVAPYLARRLEELGLAMVTIHGRTTAMRFSGEARLDGIAAVVSAVSRIPVIGNGDVRKPEDARRMIEVTGCAGVMIGRGALSMPWIFRDTWSYLTTGAIPPPPSIEEKCQLMRDHFHGMVRFRSERAAVNEFRRRVSWYAKQMNPCHMLKERMQVIQCTADFERAIDEFLEWRLQHDAAELAGLAERNEPVSAA